MNHSHFTCANCGETFKSNPDQTEEQKQAELANNFPGDRSEDCATVCDDCYFLIQQEILDQNLRN